MSDITMSTSAESTQLYSGPICDTHVHIMDLDTMYYPWLKARGPDADKQMPAHPLVGSLDPIRKNYMVDDLLEDAKAHNLTRAVHIQGAAADDWAEAEWIESLNHPSGIPHVQVGHVDLSAPAEEVEAKLQKLASLEKMRGVRQLLNWHPTTPTSCFCGSPDIMTSDNFVKNYALLAKYNMHFELHAYPWQFLDILPLVQQHPTVPLIINHGGICLERDESSVKQYREVLATLAKEPNVFMKISGLGMVDNKWTEDSITPFVNYCIDAFGVDRCMFASNFPVEKLLGTFDQWFTAFKRIVAKKGLSQDDQQKLFYSNGVKIYRIPQ